MKSKLATLTLILSFFACFEASAQWLPMSSPVQGIKTWKIKTVGNRLYALTNQGPYVSDNEGLTWVSFINGLPTWDQSIEYRSMDANANQIMVGSSTGKVYTTNPSSSFVDVSAGLPTSKVTAIQLVGPVAVTGFQSGGLYRSNNNGASWIQGTINSSSLAVNNLHFGAGLLFATTDNGVYASADTGKTWTPRSNGLNSLNTIAFTNVGNQLIASTTLGISVSSIASPTWVAATPTGVDGLVDVIVKNSTTYVLGLRGGKTCVYGDDLNGPFEQSNDLPKDGAVLTLSAKGSRTFAGLDGGGVSMSENLGASWVPQCVGLPNQTEINKLILNQLSFFVTTKPLTYGRSSGGFFAYTRAGQARNNWQLLGTQGHSDQTGVDVLSFDMKLPYLLTGASEQGILRSNDYSSTWASSNSGIPAGTSDRTINNIRMLSQSRVVAATGAGVVFSSDTGYTWTKTLSGTLSERVWDFEKIDEVLFASSDKGIFKSLDTGESWTQLPTFANQEIRTLASLGTTLYAGLNNQVQKSTNNGANWQDITNNLSVTGIKDVLLAHGLILVAHSAGVHMSQDDGQSWTPFSENLPNRGVKTIISPDTGTSLYAGLESGGSSEPGGIYRRNIGLIIQNAPILTPQTNSFEIQTLYPNPSSGHFLVGILTASTGDVKLEICDLLGKSIRVENRQIQKQGESAFNIQHSLVPGLYLLRVMQNGTVRTRQFAVE